ncbi:MAG TPA: hypothetical protein VHL11_20160 [Phototrophicaceae bacterium]|jgi:dihydroorotate dehydrogenase|nr:hypothetical protein [Phototrophicaceae bacterium]
MFNGDDRTLISSTLLAIYRVMYRYLARPLIFQMDAETAHSRAMEALNYFDAHPELLALIHRLTFSSIPTQVGGTCLDAPLMLAAGFVKGEGFATETEALKAVADGQNIIPGWRSMPSLAGAVEFGSFTRYPRVGNPGVVLWRDARTRSTQNRVGLKNPGAVAAAEFLSTRPLPFIFGINIAVSPGVSDPDQEQQEVVEAFRAFLSRGVHPTWFTLNVSCPNTEDDPGDHQTEARTRALVRRIIAGLEKLPLWVKISPNLAESQYLTLLRVFEEEGVQAVIASNTQPEPSPLDPSLTAGVGGGRLHQTAVKVAALLAQEKRQQGYHLDIIGCGGVQTPPDYYDFVRYSGVRAVQYWSALIYQGPLAAALILHEIEVEGRECGEQQPK